MKEVEKKLRSIVDKLSYKQLKLVLVVSLFLLLLSFYGKDMLKKIEVFGIAEWVTTIENLAAPIFSYIDCLIVKSLIWILFFVTLLLLISKMVLRRKAMVINHCTFANTQSSYDKSMMRNLSIRQRDINLVDLMKEKKIVNAVVAQDKLISSILRECDEYTEVFYYGIAHIPLIFRAGFQFGDEGKVRLLHKYRNEQDVFKEISSAADNFTVDLKKTYRALRRNSKEMLAVIATSFPVLSEDLEVFRNNTIGHELYFEMNDRAFYGVDIIDSYATMNRFRAYILSNIREIVASQNITKIHLVLSTSSDFAFFLAQGFSKYHDPEIVAYQYECSEPQRYPWGISNKEPSPVAIIWQ